MILFCHRNISIVVEAESEKDVELFLTYQVNLNFH